VRPCVRARVCTRVCVGVFESVCVFVSSANSCAAFVCVSVCVRAYFCRFCYCCCCCSRVSQMDLESASWQMVTLCLDPKSELYLHYLHYFLGIFRNIWNIITCIRICACKNTRMYVHVHPHTYTFTYAYRIVVYIHKCTHTHAHTFA